LSSAGPTCARRTLPPRAAEWPARDFVLLGQHDRQDAPGERGVRRIGRPELKLAVVVVDLPEQTLPRDRERAEVVLAVGIVLYGEGVEGGHGDERCGHEVWAAVADALGEHPALGGAIAERIVLAGKGGNWDCGHGDFHRRRTLMARRAAPRTAGRRPRREQIAQRSWTSRATG